MVDHLSADANGVMTVSFDNSPSTAA